MKDTILLRVILLQVSLLTLDAPHLSHVVGPVLDFAFVVIDDAWTPPRACAPVVAVVVRTALSEWDWISRSDR